MSVSLGLYFSMDYRELLANHDNRLIFIEGGLSLYFSTSYTKSMMNRGNLLIFKKDKMRFLEIKELSKIGFDR